MPELTYLQAISDGLREEMRADDSVFCLGEDIGAFGGAFKITDGFMEEFGEKRVWDTPLAENAIIGTAVGCAIEGMKPVAEMQFADFISCGFDQLVNVAAKMHYRQGVAVPMVVRLPSGGGFSGGPYHSQNPEAWFMQSPGLKIVAPSTAEDAKGLIAASIQDPNPVVYMEHKHLYRRVKGEVPEGRYETPIGEARLAREGTDLTVVSYGAMVWTALEATEDLEGAAVEVLDLRSLVPLDRESILQSVRKTSKVVLLQEATRSAGAMAEVAAIIADEAWEDLDGPVKRVSAPDVPIPFSPPLERAVLPQVDSVREACRELLTYLHHDRRRDDAPDCRLGRRGNDRRLEEAPRRLDRARRDDRRDLDRQDRDGDPFAGCWPRDGSPGRGRSDRAGRRGACPDRRRFEARTAACRRTPVRRRRRHGWRRRGGCPGADQRRQRPYGRPPAARIAGRATDRGRASRGPRSAAWHRHARADHEEGHRRVHRERGAEARAAKGRAGAAHGVALSRGSAGGRGGGARPGAGGGPAGGGPRRRGAAGGAARRGAGPLRGGAALAHAQEDRRA